MDLESVLLFPLWSLKHPLTEWSGESKKDEDMEYILLCVVSFCLVVWVDGLGGVKEAERAEGRKKGRMRREISLSSNQLLRILP